MSRPPTIGITGLGGAGETEYERAVRGGGGDPLRLENDLAKIDEYLESCDGFAFSGGWDVSPLHGGSASPKQTYEPERDVFELELAKRLRRLRIPTLGICKGLQVINVAFGGKLIADLHADCGLDPGSHAPRLPSGEKNRDILMSHVVTLEEGALSRACGERSFPTTARHHQAIDPAHLGADLRVVGHTPDGVIEAIEATFPHPFFAAVQWHPETSALVQKDPRSLSLFSRFVDVCRATAER